MLTAKSEVEEPTHGKDVFVHGHERRGRGPAHVESVPSCAKETSRIVKRKKRTRKLPTRKGKNVRNGHVADLNVSFWERDDGVDRDAAQVRNRMKTCSCGTRRSSVRTRRRGKEACSPYASRSAISILKNHRGSDSPLKCFIPTCTVMARCAWTSSRTDGALATASPLC